MFNGIIYNQGLVRNIRTTSEGATIEVYATNKFTKNKLGTSISCDGVCLTLTKKKGKSLYFYLSRETLKRSNFKIIKKGQYINLENSLIFGQDISGHYTQGHVDTTGKIKNISKVGKSWVLNISILSKYRKYLMEKGSISINGVSLTLSKIKKNSFEIFIIPHTLKLTNLIKIKKNDLVNIEFDIFGKYLLNLNK